jgi:hypothetical protein
MRQFSCAVVLVGLAGFSAQAKADDLADLAKMMEMANILGAEAPCAMPLDAAAVSRWVAENVDATDTGFTTGLPGYTKASEAQIKGMSGAAKAAQCTAIRRQAEAFGLLAP